MSKLGFRVYLLLAAPALEGGRRRVTPLGGLGVSPVAPRP